MLSPLLLITSTDSNNKRLNVSVGGFIMIYRHQEVRLIRRKKCSLNLEISQYFDIGISLTSLFLHLRKLYS